MFIIADVRNNGVSARRELTIVPKLNSVFQSPHFVLKCLLSPTHAFVIMHLTKVKYDRSERLVEPSKTLYALNNYVGYY